MLTPHAAPPIVVTDEPIGNFSNHKTIIGAVTLLAAIDVIKDRYLAITIDDTGRGWNRLLTFSERSNISTLITLNAGRSKRTLQRDSGVPKSPGV